MGTPPQPSTLRSSFSDCVARDISPALLISSDPRGQVLQCNGATLRFVAKADVVDWADLFPEPDLSNWRRTLQASCQTLEPVGQAFRLRRFDNAIRTYILKAEPQYGPDGSLQGHLVSGLDVSDILSQSGHSPDDSSARQIAGAWHGQLVSNVTIIASSADIIEDLVEKDSSPLLNGAINKLGEASSSLRQQLKALSSMARAEAHQP